MRKTVARYWTTHGDATADLPRHRPVKIVRSPSLISLSRQAVESLVNPARHPSALRLDEAAAANAVSAVLSS